MLIIAIVSFSCYVVDHDAGNDITWLEMFVKVDVKPASDKEGAKE